MTTWVVAIINLGFVVVPWDEHGGGRIKHTAQYRKLKQFKNGVVTTIQVDTG